MRNSPSSICTSSCAIFISTNLRHSNIITIQTVSTPPTVLVTYAPILVLHHAPITVVAVEIIGKGVCRELLSWYLFSWRLLLLRISLGLFFRGSVGPCRVCLPKGVAVCTKGTHLFGMEISEISLCFEGKKEKASCEGVKAASSWNDFFRAQGRKSVPHLVGLESIVHEVFL